MILQRIYLFILGLIFGSFISALTWRYPRSISIAEGRSLCPNCKKQIAWYDNIPLLSFLLLGGKCRNCRKPISWRYFLIELSTGIGFLFTFKGETFQGVYSIILLLILETIFIIDLENQIIPDSFTFIGILLTFIYTLYFAPNSLYSSILAGFTSAVFLLLIHLVTNGRGMGLGDVKFAVLGGMIIGLNLFSIWLFLAFLTGAAIGIILILGKKAGLKSKIAFGPFLIISIPITLLWGQKIIDLMLSH